MNETKKDMKPGVMRHRGVLSCIKGVRETTDTKEVAQMLSSGNWIALYATIGEVPTFVMGKVSG